MTSQTPIVAQRLTLVLPSTGAHDSRTWRIAGSVAARGHGVTVVARLGDGLPAEEVVSPGYRILRVPVDAVDGLPAPLRRIARRVRGRPARTPHAIGSPARIAGTPRGRLRQAVAATWRLLAIGLTIRAQQLATRRVAPAADLVHAMAYMGIPVGLDLGRRDGMPVIYDARDIYIDARNIARLPAPLRRVFARVERRWARRAARVVTVNEPYAEVLADRFGTGRPLVVMNCARRGQPPPVRRRRFHERLGLPPDRRVVLYHGGLSPDRGIEQLLSAIGEIPNATLVLMGYGDLERSIRTTSEAAGLADRVAVLPAVPPSELVDWVSAADVAAMLIQPTTLNHRLTTPNKLFEAIAADVPVVASDLPGMAPIVQATGCGVVVDPTDPALVAAAIRSVLDASPDRRAAFSEGLRRAREAYQWEREVERLIAEYGRLTGRPW